MDIILKEGVRILRPDEYKLIEESLDNINKIKFNTSLLTGMRYIELRRFQDNPNWFDSKRGFIHLPVTAVKKHKRKQKDRWVRLNTLGRTYIDFFISDKENLFPTRATWNENLKRWAKKVDLDVTGICPKTTRKTWESWLTFLYPEKLMQITLSQGHTTMTSLGHYQQMPFIDEDKPLMEEYTRGW